MVRFTFQMIKRVRFTAFAIKVSRGVGVNNSIVKLFAILALCANLNAHAETAAGQLSLGQPASGQPAVSASELPKMLIYIQSVEYTSPISLWSPYQNYWFYHGPIVEGQAMEKLGQSYGDVGFCEANQSAKTLVWLKPKMFYNPQVQMFYAEVVANIYTGMGKLIGSYVGESKQHGFLNAQAEGWITKAYGLAIDDMISKMQADTALQALLDNANIATAADAAACSSVTLFPIPKIRLMSF
jgi:hypothetical protein